MKQSTLYYIGEIILISGIITDQIIFFLLFKILRIPPNEILKGENYTYTLLFLLISTLIIFFLFYFFQKIDTLKDKNLKIPIFKKINKKTILISLICFFVFYLFMIISSSIANLFLGKSNILKNPLLQNIKNFKDLIILAIGGAIGGAFREELQRSFVLQRFDVIFKLPYTGLIIWSTYFALGHINQGVFAIFIVGIIGLGLGFIYLKYKNFDINFFTHLFFNFFSIFSFFIYKKFF